MEMVPGACEMNQNNDSGSSNTTGKYAAKMHVDNHRTVEQNRKP